MVFLLQPHKGYECATMPGLGDIFEVTGLDSGQHALELMPSNPPISVGTLSSTLLLQVPFPIPNPKYTAPILYPRDVDFKHVSFKPWILSHLNL